MLAKTSKEVTDRQTVCRFLLTALEGSQGTGVATALLGLARPHLQEGDDEPGFVSSVVALARMLTASHNRLVAADEKVYAANARLTKLRDQRDQLTADLGGKIVHLRHTLQGQFRGPRFDALGLEGRTARKPEPLLRQADRIAATFARDDLDEILGEPFFEGSFDPRGQAAELRPSAEALRANLHQVDEGKRAHDEALIEKYRAMAEHDQFLLHTARCFESWCRIAGEKELADRVRPSATRAGPEEALNDLPDPGGEPPQGGEPSSEETAEE